MILHSFLLGDCEDPEIYAAQPLYEWQQTEAGKFVMANCKDVKYNIMPDPYNFGYRVNIVGDLSAKDSTYYSLKFK